MLKRTLGVMLFVILWPSFCYAIDPFWGVNQGLRDFQNTLMQIRAMEMEDRRMDMQRKLMEAEIGLMKAQAESLRKPIEDAYKKGFETGYKKAIDDAIKYIENNIDTITVNSFQHIGTLIFTENSIDEIKNTRVIVEGNVKKYPENYFNKMFLILLDARLKEIEGGKP